MGLQAADRYHLGERGGAGLGERVEDVGDLGRADGADPVPRSRGRLVGGGLDRVVHDPAGRGQRTVLADPAAFGQPGARGVPLLIGPAADGLHEIAGDRAVLRAPQHDRLAAVDVGGGQRGEVAIAAMLAQHPRRLPQPGQRVGRDRQLGVRGREHPPGEVAAPVAAQAGLGERAQRLRHEVRHIVDRLEHRPHRPRRAHRVRHDRSLRHTAQPRGRAAKCTTVNGS